jgi:hypothetical protein
MKPLAPNPASPSAAYRKQLSRVSLCGPALLCLIFASRASLAQQDAPEETPQQQIQRLTQAVAQAQAQLEASQQQLLQLKDSLQALTERLAKDGQLSSDSKAQPAASAKPTPASVSNDDLRDRQAMQETQIATLDQAKVESDSKYPVKISGLILLNGFVNTSQVDNAVVPAMAVPGAGSTGASLRQTVLGFDARGPRLAGATSRADLRVDFFGSAAATTSGTSQTSYAELGGLLRLRTAHATLDWEHTQAFVELDRPIVSPNAPTSLVAVAEPALAWSGNLWAWSPQVGISHTLDLGASSHLALEAALIDVPDPPPLQSTAVVGGVSQSERSRWPGSEIHLGLLGNADGPSIGVGGYFSPHKTTTGAGFNSWAGTLDFRLPLPESFEMSGSFYRGLGLGGLGGGAYKDYIYIYSSGETVPLDDVGGWAQVKKTAGPRLEFNGAFGMDNIFSSEMREYASTATTGYLGLTRNRTFFANTIYSPSAYLLLSLEVRHITSTPITGPAADSNVIGIGAGYKF